MREKEENEKYRKVRSKYYIRKSEKMNDITEKIDGRIYLLTKIGQNPKL